MADDPLFRKAALDKLASPERLDVLMQVTSPKSWIALWTIGGLLAGVVAWSVWGSLPERIDGQGLLQGQGGLRQIRASGDGRLTGLELAVNREVTVDRIVGRIEAVTMEQTVQTADTEYQTTLAANQAADAADQVTLASLQIQRDRTEGTLTKAETNLQQRRANLEAGIGTANRVRDAEAEVDAIQKEILGVDRQMNAVRSQKRQRDINLERIRQRVSGTRKTVRASSEIRSTVAGKVVSVTKQVGDLVRTGELLAEVETAAGRTLDAVAFVSATTGQRVKEGHNVQITVAGVKREEFGFLRGIVKSVSQYAETPESIAATMRDLQISEASYKVTIAPTTDPSTPSGYAWSTGSGPSTQISGGTKITVAVEVDSRAPISLVLPVLKRSFGG